MREEQDRTIVKADGLHQVRSCSGPASADGRDGTTSSASGSSMTLGFRVEYAIKTAVSLSGGYGLLFYIADQMFRLLDCAGMHR